ncbi:hypothetical protein EON63_07245 [archaeon]|nr:MAG: hypothetical protein EON63_07245 [archaeon]
MQAIHFCGWPSFSLFFRPPDNDNPMYISAYHDGRGFNGHMARIHPTALSKVQISEDMLIPMPFGLV